MAVLCVAVICLIFLGINFISNEIFISKYNKSEYTTNKLGVLGFTEPYISKYNNGCVYYNEGSYDVAISEFKAALNKNPKGDRDCYTRINLALSMVKTINPDEITEANIDETIELLKEAREYLLENGCANEDPDKAHNEDAQTLKEEIDDFIKQLEEQKKSENNDPDDNKDPSETDEPESEPESESQTKSQQEQQLQDLQNQAGQNRQEEMQNAEKHPYDLEYWNGPSW